MPLEEQVLYQGVKLTEEVINKIERLRSLCQLQETHSIRDVEKIKNISLDMHRAVLLTQDETARLNKLSLILDGRISAKFKLSTLKLGFRRVGTELGFIVGQLNYLVSKIMYFSDSQTIRIELIDRKMQHLRSEDKHPAPIKNEKNYLKNYMELMEFLALSISESAEQFINTSININHFSDKCLEYRETLPEFDYPSELDVNELPKSTRAMMAEILQKKDILISVLLRISEGMRSLKQLRDEDHFVMESLLIQAREFRDFASQMKQQHPELTKANITVMDNSIPKLERLRA
jgi:hypothetical protein